MAESKHCDRHDIDYMDNAYCIECEKEYILSGRYQKFLEDALSRTVDGDWVIGDHLIDRRVQAHG